MEEHARKNLQDAFVGDPDPLSEGANADATGPEAVEFKITAGTLRVQVPHGTKTEDILGGDRFYEADLTLEDGTRVAIQIAQGSDGANVVVHKDTSPGLSGIESDAASALDKSEH